MVQSSIPPTGTQYDIVRRNQRAIITEVGATLRCYTVAGRDVIAPFPETASPVSCQGQHLMPWPNRIRDGRYTWEGSDHQLPINEVDRNNALHGLLSWAPWQLCELYASMVRLRTVLYPQPGWPGTLSCEITHELTEEGLLVEVTATNLGSSKVPFGYAAHPYFTFGVPIDELDLELPFTTRLEVDDRLLPLSLTSIDPVSGQLGRTTYDTAFTRPRRDANGRWQVVLGSEDRAIGLWADHTMPWLQVYTPEDRTSIAIEPMTCGPDAFNPGPSHDDLIVLAPEETFRGRWGITPQ